MLDTFSVTANLRPNLGKGESRRLRRSDYIPAVLYGAGKAPINITLVHNDFFRALENRAFYTHILTLKMDGQEEKVILRDLQRHPFKPKILHVDFQRISATEKLTMNIPLRFQGGDIAPGVKLKGGIVAHLLSDVEIRCLPKDLPEYIMVDLSKLELDQTIHLSDLASPKDTEIYGLVPGSANDKPVVSIHMPRAAVEETVEAPVSAAVETIAEAKAKEAAALEGKAVPETPPVKEKEKEKEKGKKE
jgi:large subunit ribosomal protein L25